MKVTFIRYRYLEKVGLLYRMTNRFLPRKFMRKWRLRNRNIRNTKSAEGEFHGIEMELPFDKQTEQLIGKDVVWKFLEHHIEEQKKQYGNITVLLKGELFSLYCEQKSMFSCYPFQCQSIPLITRNEEGEEKGHTVCTLLNRRNSIDWMKLFFIKELTEYYRLLYGIRKKILKLVIIEGELEETKRVIEILAHDLNYMTVKTEEKERYEELAKEIYEETGLSIIFMKREKEIQKGMEKEIQETKRNNASILIDLNDLYPKANGIRITQRGMWVDQEVLTAILMEQTMNVYGSIVEERLQEWKQQYGLYLKKII